MIDHLFCSTCGVTSFARGKGQDGKAMVAINTRCLDGVDAIRPCLLAELLVQLGYDGAGNALLFVPEWSAQGLGVPLTGSRLDDDRLAHISPLVVVEATPPAPGIH